MDLDESRTLNNAAFGLAVIAATRRRDQRMSEAAEVDRVQPDEQQVEVENPVVDPHKAHVRFLHTSEWSNVITFW